MCLTSQLYRAARASAAVRAIRRGRVPQRMVNIAIGRGLGRLGLWRIWR
jgi:hypothetical protein